MTLFRVFRTQCAHDFIEFFDSNSGSDTQKFKAKKTPLYTSTMDPSSDLDRRRDRTSASGTPQRPALTKEEAAARTGQPTIREEIESGASSPEAKPPLSYHPEDFAAYVPMSITGVALDPVVPPDPPGHMLRTLEEVFDDHPTLYNIAVVPFRLEDPSGVKEGGLGRAGRVRCVREEARCDGYGRARRATHRGANGPPPGHDRRDAQFPGSPTWSQLPAPREVHGHRRCPRQALQQQGRPPA